MTTNQLSRLKMYITLRGFLTTNAELVAKLPNSAEFIAALDAAIEQIQTNDEEHHQSGRGVTEKKNQLRDELVAVTVDNSRKMQAYAKYRNDTVLFAESKFTRTELNNMPGMELVNVANGLFGIIQSRLAEVTSYTLTADSQAQFRTAIDDFASSIPQPRESLLKSKENILLENQGFEMGDAALEHLDAVVEIVRLTEPLFYTGYKNARKIVFQGTGSLQMKGIVVEATNNKPIPNAILTFCLSGQTEVVLEKETAVKGGFVIKTLEEGIYDVTVTKMGFKTQTVSATVRWDQLSQLEVKMEAIEVMKR